MSNENLPALNNFEATLRLANQLAKSDFLPDTYKNKPANCFIAIQIAQGHNKDFLTIVQNLHIIQGRPSWSAQYVIALINGKYGENWEYKFKDIGEKRNIEYDNYGKGKISIPLINDRECWVEATDKKGRIIKGSSITLEMAIKEGWYTKSGSKWKTMPEQMLKYRAASFFASIYLAGEKQGIMTIEEAEDIAPERDVTPQKPEKTKKELYDELMLEFKKLFDTKIFSSEEIQECREKIVSYNKNLDNIKVYLDAVNEEYASRLAVIESNKQQKDDTLTILPIDEESSLYKDADKGFTNA